MAGRFAGTAYFKVDGVQYALRGNLMVSPSNTERAGIPGQDGVHGFSENPVVPFIEGDVSLLEGTSVEDVDAVTDATVTVELANGSSYVLRSAWRSSRSEINTHDGMFRVRFEGLSCDELTS
jgi:uncharacterized protein YlzI (FlbEa/FlbD family)